MVRTLKSLTDSRNPALRWRRSSRTLLAVLMTAVIFTVMVAPFAEAARKRIALRIPPRTNHAVVQLMSSRRRRRRQRREPANAAACYSRFSSDEQDTQTLETQEVFCCEVAAREGKSIPEELRFRDEAVSGTKLEREGLNKLIKAAEAGLFNTLFFFSLSRLARDVCIGLSLFRRLVYVYGIRIVSQADGVDTARPGWEMLVQVLFWQHEKFIADLSRNVFDGQASTVRNQYGVGDQCFGYGSEPIPGTEYGRRRERCRMRYVINEVDAGWVRQIFVWFVEECRTIAWIVRELNRCGVGKDHRSKHKETWRRQNVITVLTNEKYIGRWQWGEMRNVRDEVGNVTQEPRSAEVAQQYYRELPDLRIIDDETFNKAQQRLEKNRETYVGPRNEDGEFVRGRRGGAAPAQCLLSGLLECGACGRPFYIGRYLFCRGRLDRSCACRTSVKRALAETLILQEIAGRLSADERWFAELVRQTTQKWSARQAALPDEVRDLEQALDAVQGRIRGLLDTAETCSRPDPDISDRLAERRRERDDLQRRLDAARAEGQRQPEEPSQDWIKGQLEVLMDVLRSATPAAGEALAELVGGKIRMVEVREPGRSRPYLRGTFVLPVCGMVAKFSGTIPEAGEPSVEPIAIDFVEHDPRADQPDRAWALQEQGWSYETIAQELECSGNHVTKLLREAAAQRGVPVPDGRSSVVRLSRVDKRPALFERMAPEVGRLADENLSLEEIGKRLNLDRTTLRRAFNKDRADRGLPPLDGRNRRKQLNDERRGKDDAA